MSFFKKLAKVIGIPVEKADVRIALNPPYVVYFIEDEINTYADGIIVYSEAVISIYALHSKEDFITETKIESFLINQNIAYENKENVWIEDIELIETRYTINLQVEGEI